MKLRMFNDIWKDDNYDVTDKIIEVFYLGGGELWENFNCLITTNDGKLRSDENGKWAKETVSVNMEQIRKRVDEFLHSDLPCFNDVYENNFLVTMRNNMEDEQFVELAELW